MPKENHEFEFGWNLHDQIARYDRGGGKGTPIRKQAGILSKTTLLQKLKHI